MYLKMTLSNYVFFLH